MLKANEGNMIKTVTNKSLLSTTVGPVVPSGPPAKISKIPMMPKAIDAQINTRVAMICIRAV